VKFGIFFELSVPRPWTQESERTVFLNAMEQAKLADELGFDQCWAVEHHFLEEYSHCSSPEIFLSAVAAQTTRIHLGFGIAVCVPQYHHPIRVAEKVAFLDVISGGRVEAGTGRSSTWVELGAFGADPDTTKQTWDEYVRILPGMWTQDRFSYRGRFVTIPERSILPKPYQKPHPPMWVAVSSPGTELEAADRGMGMLGITFGSPAEQEQKVAEYRRRVRQCEPVGHFVNDQVNVSSFLSCFEEREKGVARGQQLQRMFGYLAAQNLSAKESYPSTSYKSGGLLPALRQEIAGPETGIQVPQGQCWGDPQTVTAALKEWEAIGVDRINFMLNVAEIMPQDEVLASMRLFAREVMPHFDPDARRTRAAELAASAAGGA
jgi:alkanesulfonate monooxygenase SsuD/methylene tetrahydromethanopterin reductase-like flavin-dependent oxidoreductase (luciferase family)